MKSYVAGLLLLLCALGNAQNANQLLDKVRLAHGGLAIANIKTYSETAQLTTYSSGAPTSEITVISYVDFIGQRLRIEYRDGKNLIQVLQVTPTAKQSWDAQAGTHSMGEEIAKDIAAGFMQSWYGLRLGGTGRSKVELLGQKTFADLKGQAIAVTTKGVSTTYLINTKNQLIAERYENSQGLTTVAYSNLRSVGGILIPFQARIYADGQLFAEAQIKEAKVNPVLNEKTFKMP